MSFDYESPDIEPDGLNEEWDELVEELRETKRELHATNLELERLRPVCVAQLKLLKEMRHIIATVIDQNESLALDNAEDRRTLYKALTKDLPNV